MHPYIAELLIKEQVRERGEIATVRRLDRLGRTGRPAGLRFALPRRLRRARPTWNTRVI